jgi:catechol 2,3-dioxygenase-like lactoylglutathione lyase family enzyme
MKFRYTILYVRDVRATLDFYARAFGQTQGFLHDSGHFGELQTGVHRPHRPACL